MGSSAAASAPTPSELEPIFSTSTAAAPPTTTQFSAGDSVVCHGLVSRKDLNGVIGIVRKYDAEKGRYAVTLPDRTSILLKADNLKHRTPDRPVEPPLTETREAPSKDELLHEVHSLLRDGLLQANLLKPEERHGGPLRPQPPHPDSGSGTPGPDEHIV